MEPLSTKAPSENFIFLQKLGEGSFGTVVKAKRLSDQQFYAVKKIKLFDMKSRDKNNALKQINMLAVINSPYVINYKEAFLNQATGQLCTVMELATNGDLAEKTKKKKQLKQFYYEYQIWKIGRDILQGLSALHEKNIVHRDIKPANIFFSEDGHAKIGDLNVSTILSNRLAYTQTGTPYYASPQIWGNQAYGFQCDIWSFGCLIYELCCLTQPFKGMSMQQIYSKIRKCKYEPIPKKYSESLKSVISKCLAHKNKRSKLPELIEIFAKNTAPKSYASCKNLNSNKHIPLQNKKLSVFPSNQAEFSEILPQPQYQNQLNEFSLDEKCQQKSESSQKSIQKPSYLDRFIRVIPGLNQKNTNVKVHSVDCKRKLGSEKDLINCEKPKIKNQQPGYRRFSYNLLPEKNSQKKLEIPSFRKIIGLCNPENKNLKRFQKDAIDRINLRRRRLRIAMNY